MDSTLQLANTRSAESFSAFKAAVGSSVYFHDKDHGLLWLRVVGDYQREQGDYQPCGNDDAGCFNETIKFQSLGSDLSTDCRARPALLEVVFDMRAFKYKFNHGRFVGFIEISVHCC